MSIQQKNLAVMCALWLFYSFSYSTTYYVSTDGNDSWAGTSSSPWKTFNKAASSLQAGDTAIIKGGTYANQQGAVSRSGQPGKWMTFLSDTLDRAIFEGGSISTTASYVRVQGFRVQNTEIGISISGPNVSHIVIAHNETYNTHGSGICAWGVPWGSNPGTYNYQCITNLVVTHNKIEKACNGGWNECMSLANGIDTFEVSYNELLNGGDPTNGGEGIDPKETCRNGKIFNNYLHNLTRHGIYIDAGQSAGDSYNIEIYNNTVHHMVGEGIALTSEAGSALHDVKIYNNIVYKNGRNGILLYQRAGPMRNFTVINNTTYCNGTTGGYYDGGVHVTDAAIANVTVRNNIAWRNRDYEIGTVTGNVVDHNYTTGNPLFKDTVNGDFHLLAGSPCINAGSITLAPAFDFDNRQRSDGQPDIGALEYYPQSAVFFSKAEKPAAGKNAFVVLRYGVRCPLDLPGDLGIRMFDVSGKTVRNYGVPGIYCIRVTTGNTCPKELKSDSRQSVH